MTFCMTPFKLSYKQVQMMSVPFNKIKWMVQIQKIMNKNVYYHKRDQETKKGK